MGYYQYFPSLIMIVDYNESCKYLHEAMNTEFNSLNNYQLKELDSLYYNNHNNRYCRYDECPYDYDIKYRCCAPFFDTIESDIRNIYNFKYWEENSSKMISHITWYEINKNTNKLESKQWGTDYHDINDIYNWLDSFNCMNRVYQDDNFLRLYHIDMNQHDYSGGIVLFIEKNTNNIKVHSISEDDGYIFPNYYMYVDFEERGITRYECYVLCQMLNDINVSGINIQEVIQKLFNKINE